MSTCTWPLGNGESVECTIYDPYSTNWNAVAGIYIFAYRDRQKPNTWYAVYVGEAEKFSDRLPSHERWNEAVRLGATHIHARVVPLAAIRDSYEKLLIRNLQPPMNVQHR